MNIGTGIFLAALSISIVIIYIHTKDKINWKKKLRNLSLWIVGLSALTAASFFSVSYYNELPKIIHEFYGITLGEFREDVIFKLGEPNNENDEQYLIYDNLVIFFKDNRVFEIRFICCGKNEELNGITCTCNSNDIQKKYNNDLKLYNDKNPTFRIFQAQKYSAIYFLLHNEVIAMSIGYVPYEIANPEESPLTPEEQVELNILEMMEGAVSLTVYSDTSR